MMVDDAHASGVLGSNGRGTVDHFGLHGRVQVQVGTLSKAVGVLGGYVCGSRDLIEYLYHRARPFLFSTSHPPAVTAACMAAFEILENEPERVQLLWDNTRYYQGAAAGGGLRHRRHADADHAADRRRGRDRPRVFAALFAEGLWATGIGFPTVPKGKARIRTIVTAAHTREHLDRAVETLARVAKQMRILS